MMMTTTMKKLFATVLAVASIATISQANAEPSNSEIGCSLLNMAMATRIEQLQDVDPVNCAKMKAEINGDWFLCIAPTIVTYNRVRGLPDLTRPPMHIRQLVTKACIMVVFDIPEGKAEAVAKRALVEMKDD
jgi:hypothetical protein